MSTETELLRNPARLVISRRIEWIDTDAAGIWHWTVTCRLAEAAEAELHTALGIADITFGATPRLAVSFEFKRPLRFNDEIGVELVVEAVGRTSIAYGITIRTDDEAIAATGQMKACFIDRSTGRPTPWPDDVRAALVSGGPQAGA
jgi:acyl-CoA thioester hydrolase